MNDSDTTVCGNTTNVPFAPLRAEPIPPWAQISGVSAAEVLAEVGRINASADFQGSQRNRRVLEYLVLRHLEERNDQLKPYYIATRVYGRPETFNPIKDPIVRIEMAKLRRDLEVYYLKSGAGNPLRISIPRGGYVPRVTRVPSGGSADATAGVFLVSVLRAALCAWSGDREGAAAAWQDLKLADPSWPANLQTGVSKEVGDQKVSRLIVEGALRAGRWADSPQADPATDKLL